MVSRPLLYAAAGAATIGAVIFGAIRRDGAEDVVPAEPEAVQELESVVNSLASGGPAALCSGPQQLTFCNELLAGDGALRAPSEPPRVVESKAVPGERGRAPGRVLLL